MRRSDVGTAPFKLRHAPERIAIREVPYGQSATQRSIQIHGGTTEINPCLQVHRRELSQRQSTRTGPTRTKERSASAVRSSATRLSSSHCLISIRTISVAAHRQRCLLHARAKASFAILMDGTAATSSHL